MTFLDNSHLESKILYLCTYIQGMEVNFTTKINKIIHIYNLLMSWSILYKFVL